MNYVRTRLAFILASIMMAALLVACAGSEPTDGEPNNPAITDPGSIPSPAATNIGNFSALTTPATPTQKVTALKNVLSLGGIRTGDIDTFYTETVGTSARGYMSEFDAIKLAREFDNGSIPALVTLPELAAFLASAGWAELKADFSADDILLFMQDWLVIARAAPSDPFNANILLIDEINRLRTPAVDLLSADMTADQIVMSSLEVELLVAGIERLFVEVIPATTQKASIPAQNVTDDKVVARCKGDVKSKPVLTSKALMARALTPCSDLKSQFGKDIENIAGAGYDYIGPAGVSEILENRFDVSKGNVEKFGKALDVLKLLKTAHRLYMLYANVTLTLEAQDGDSAHKPVEGTKATKTIIARAKIDEAAWNDYKKSLEDAGISGKISQATQNCLKEAGFPTTNNLDDIASVIENWRVDWNIVKGSSCGIANQFGGPNCHAYLSSDSNTFISTAGNPYGTKVTKDGEAAGKSELAVDLTTEPVASHPNGVLKHAKVLVKGELKTAEPPALSTFTGAAQGGLGLANSLAELVAGFVQSVAPPKAYQTLDVTYHVADGWDGTITVTVNGAVSKSETSANGSITTFDANYTETATYGVDRSRRVDVLDYAELEQIYASIPPTPGFNFDEAVAAFGDARGKIVYTVPAMLQGEIKENYKYDYFGVEEKDPCTDELYGGETIKHEHKLASFFSEGGKNSSASFTITYDPVKKTYELSFFHLLIGDKPSFSGNYSYSIVAPNNVPPLNKSDSGLVVESVNKSSPAVAQYDFSGTASGTTPLRFEGGVTSKKDYTMSAVKGEMVGDKSVGVDSNSIPSATVPVTINVKAKLTVDKAK